MSNINESDRKIINTGKTGLISGEAFRLPGVTVVGGSFEEGGSGSAIDGGAGGSSPTTGEVGVVRNIELESQSVRIQPDGSAVIDVVVSFERAENAATHEVRLARIS